MRYVSLALVLMAALMLPVPTAHAIPMTFVANLSQANEVPPTGSPATGLATVVLDPTGSQSRMERPILTSTVMFPGSDLHRTSAPPCGEQRREQRAATVEALQRAVANPWTRICAALRSFNELRCFSHRRQLHNHVFILDRDHRKFVWKN